MLQSKERSDDMIDQNRFVMLTTSDSYREKMYDTFKIQIRPSFKRVSITYQDDTN